MQRTQTKEVDLEQSELFKAVLVPLDDGAPGHARILYGNQIADGFVTEQETSRMDGQVAWEIQEIVAQSQEMCVRCEPWIETGALQGLGLDVALVRD